MKPIRKPEVKAIVSIDGEKVNFISLKILQRVGDHHDFEIIIDHKTFDDKFLESPESKLNLIYTKVIIDLQHGDDSGGAYTFSGLITDINLIAEEGDHGYISIAGKSKTIELERGDMYATYSNTNLYSIFEEITSGVSAMTSIIAPDWKSDIAFAIQHGESDWKFLSRLCHQYSEKYYYNGLDLVIGSHPEYPVINLTYDLELSSLSVCSKLLPNQMSTYHYQREKHSFLKQSSPGEIEGANSFLQQVGQISQKLNKERQPNGPEPAYTPDMDSLIEIGNRRKVATGGRMMYIKAQSKTCDVRIGRLVQIKMPVSAGNSEIGLYRVYEVNHQLDQNGRYSCYFEALPADLHYLPTPKINLPVPHPIEVKVIDNEDPNGIGRVKVKFPFDERPCATWFPVMTPDAGGNGYGLGYPSRGYSFLPELGDSVLLSFLDGGQLSQPFIMGSMFHGKNAENLGGGKGNHIKTITDKSKGQILMNTDELGAWGITIHDRNGNIINLDTKGKNMTFTTPETMTLNAKNLKINVKENMDIIVGINKTQEIGHDFSHTSENTYQIIGKNKKEEIGDVFKQTTGEADIQSLKNNYKIRARKLAIVQGGKDVKISKG